MDGETGDTVVNTALAFRACSAASQIVVIFTNLVMKTMVKVWLRNLPHLTVVYRAKSGGVFGSPSC